MRDWKSVRGTIGEDDLDSMNPNATREPKPTIKLARAKGFLQPRLTDSMKPLTKPPNPRAAKKAPVQSTRPPTELRLSGICHAEIIITAAARGRLIKKAARQETCSTSHPPRTGPTAVVIAVGPRADCFSTTLHIEGRTDNGEAAGYEEGRSKTLNAPGDNQLANCQGKSAAAGCHGENHHADYKHSTASKEVTERSAYKNQSPKHESIRLNHPLQIDHG